MRLTHMHCPSNDGSLIIELNVFVVYRTRVRRRTGREVFWLPSCQVASFLSKDRSLTQLQNPSCLSSNMVVMGDHDHGDASPEVKVD